MSRREELIKLCQSEPEKAADLILKLEEQLNKNSKNSHKPPSSDGLKKAPAKRRKGNGKAGGQKGRSGTTLKKSEQPDRVVEHGPEQCRCCGENLVEVEGVVIGSRQEIEIPQKPIEVIEHQRLQKRCPHCGTNNEGQWPAHIRGNVQYGSRFKAFCVYLLSYQLLPYERAGDLLKVLFGYQPGGGTLSEAQQQAYQVLEPIEDEIKSAIRASPNSHGDETGMRVEGKTQWLHVCSTETHTYYYWSQYRGQQAHQDDGLLPQYQGILMHDAYSSYFALECQHALCNAHLLRDLLALYEADPNPLWPHHLRRLLQVAWAMVKQAKVDGLTQLPSDQQERIIALFDKIVQRADQRTPRNLRQAGQRGRVAQSPARNLLDRLLNHKADYLRFVTDFRVPFDNNLAERDLRMCKVQQKISGCFRTEKGADLFCRIRGYISTVRKQGYDLLPALVSLFSVSPFFPISAE